MFLGGQFNPAQALCLQQNYQEAFNASQDGPVLHSLGTGGHFLGTEQLLRSSTFEVLAANDDVRQRQM